MVDRFQFLLLSSFYPTHYQLFVDVQIKCITTLPVGRGKHQFMYTNYSFHTVQKWKWSGEHTEIAFISFLWVFIISQIRGMKSKPFFPTCSCFLGIFLQRGTNKPGYPVSVMLFFFGLYTTTCFFYYLQPTRASVFLVPRGKEKKPRNIYTGFIDVFTIKSKYELGQPGNGHYGTRHPLKRKVVFLQKESRHFI